MQMIIFRHVPSLSVGLLAEDTFDLIERCLIPLINICRPAKRQIAFVNTAGVIGDVSNLAASSVIDISIIVHCLKSGFWVRKDTLDWGLVNRAVGGSGNTSNVHQGTLPLSLSATCTITIKTTGKTGRPQNISSIRRNQLVPVQPPFLNFFDIYVHLRAHTLLSTSNRLERFPLFVKLFGFHARNFVHDFLPGRVTIVVYLLKQRPKSGCISILQYGKQSKVDNFQHQFHLFGCVFQSDHKLIGSDAVSEM